LSSQATTERPYLGSAAAAFPDRVAIAMGNGDERTYAQVEERTRRLARLFESSGLRPGDHVALMMRNRPEVIEVGWAAQRSGLYYTAINHHYTSEEAAYILNDCRASLIVVDGDTAEVAAGLVSLTPHVTRRFTVGDAFDDHESLDTALADFTGDPLERELDGIPMLYSSGTTGKPKGILYPFSENPPGTWQPLGGFAGTPVRFDNEMVYLSPAPLYHTAPLVWTMNVLRFGGKAVIMEKFLPEKALELIDGHRVTLGQFVPTMFVRMLKLPVEVRGAYDLSSLQVAVHAGAPCPIEVKEEMLEWLGPIVYEYYSASEGFGMTFIGPEEWLEHRGSVGRTKMGTIHITDNEGNELPAGEDGQIWFETTQPRISYQGDEEKTASTYDERGWASLTDMGHLDEDGYLYLTDRRTNMIVSGGVNIYPQEIEDALIIEPEVADAAVFGIPDPEFGESVKAVVELTDPSAAGPELEASLKGRLRERLASYKCPRSIDFTESLPRDPNGKLYKRKLRDPYWAGHSSRII
jgi:acyl-CoA synthetase (AMP-forming)/AMP-acid ligase II